MRLDARQPILLNPGPVNVSERVRSAAQRGDLCHREPEFAALLRRTGEKLVSAFGTAAHMPAFVTASGTAAVEMAVVAAVRPGWKLAVVENGVYGSRIRAIANAHGIEVSALEYGWTERPEPSAISRLVADPRVDALAFVHHETTTGLLNPVEEIAAATRRAGKLVVLDTVSGLGGERLDLESIDLAVSTANKAIGGLPGVSFVLVHERARPRIDQVPRRSVYLDLAANLRAQASGEPPFTPAVQILWALEAALEELSEETVARRIARFAEIASFLRGAFGDLGLECLLPAELRSNTITAVRLPRGLGYRELHDALRASGFVIYAGQGPLANEIFRVANMGHVPRAEYDRFIEVLSRIVAGSDHR